MTHRLRFVLAALACVSFAARGLAESPERVTIGGVEVSASSALARREHPRLLFSQADVPQLRERLKHPRLVAELEHAKQMAADKKAGAILLGVLYYLTGERGYIDAARAKLVPAWDQTYPLAADLVMGALGPQDQQAEAARIVEVIQKERWRPHVVHDLAAWGHGFDEFLDKDLRERYRSDLAQGVEYNNLWSQGRGGSSMSHGYYGEHFYSEWFTMALAWTTATGQDWVSRCDFAAHTPEYYLFHYRPWAPRPSVVHIGVNAMCGHWEAVSPAKFEGENLAVLAAARFHDGVGQWWVNEVISKISVGWGTSAIGQGGVWGKLLWYAPDLPPVEPNALPPARLFPENGHAVMRSDWTPDATYALFRCGRYGEIDGLWGRNNADNLHFIINKRGILAPDTGAVHSLNNTALDFAGSQVHTDSLAHITEYARQTIAHNSILIGRELLTLTSWDGKPLATIRSGGQSPIQDKTWWKLWGLSEPKAGDRPLREGRIVAYETSPLLDYAAGDATHSYPPTRVRSITRQFVYLRPDAFVVFDRVECAEAGLETRWLLHSLYEPAWKGRTAPDSSLWPDEQRVLAADGKATERNPRPGGRFLHTAGDTFVLDDRWPGMAGRMFAKVLLPSEGERTVRTIGGPWHEFEVDGTNYGPTEATYSKHKGAANTHNRENTIGLEGWRIELSPQGVPAATNFLVVLFVAGQDTLNMPPVERIEAPGHEGARITLAGKAYAVAFAMSGPLGAHVTVTEGTRTVFDRDLATSVEDNYRKWSSDPRYVAWTTQPEYRNFIGPP
jgi:hypothetical protein